MVDHCRGDENDDGNRDLHHHQQVAQSGLASAGEKRGVHRLQRRDQIDFRILERRRKAEEKYAEHSCCETEEQYAIVRSNIDVEREIGRYLDPVEEMRDSPREP